MEYDTGFTYEKCYIVLLFNNAYLFNTIKIWKQTLQLSLYVPNFECYRFAFTSF